MDIISNLESYNSTNNRIQNNKDAERKINVANLRNKIAQAPKKLKIAPLVTLNNGNKVPVYSLGTCSRKAAPGEIKQAVMDAINVGYRHFDSAYNYLNEAEVGEGIRAKIEDGTVTRDEVCVISKLWNTFHRPDLVEVCCRKSLDEFGLDYLDMYLIHFPTSFKEDTKERYPRDENGKVIFSKVDLCDTWKAMEELVHKGLVKNIGVCNYNHKQLERILSKCTIPPCVNQVEVHPYFNNMKLAEWCKERGIEVMAYSPLMCPERHADKGLNMLEDPKLLEIAHKYNRSVAQVILRWVIQRDIIVICKSSKRHRLIENFSVFDFQLSEEDIAAINGLNKNARANTYFEQAGTHPEYPFAEEF